MVVRKQSKARDLLANRLLSLMSEHRISQSGLARRIKDVAAADKRRGLGQPQISQILSRNRDTSIAVLDDFAAVFGVQVDSLFKDPARAYEQTNLTRDHQQLLAAYDQADARTHRAVRGLLEIDTDARPAIPNDAARALADLLVPAVEQAVTRANLNVRPVIAQRAQKPTPRRRSSRG